LYTEAGATLSVYSVSDPTSPVVIYQIDVGYCRSGIIADNHLYLGGCEKVRVYKVTTDFTQPLILVKEVQTKQLVYKLLRVGNEILLGESIGYLEVFDIETSSITHTHEFTEAGSINDIIPIDATHYLLAANEGLLKTTKEQLINHYQKGWLVKSLCHITDSIYLVGFVVGLKVWNEETD
jgi:hypothetical protein